MSPPQCFLASPSVQEYADTANPTNEVASLSADMSTAISNQVDVLSPNNFKEAQSALDDAKRKLDKQKSSKDTLQSVAKGRAYLNQANNFAKLSHDNIEEVIAARKLAIDAGATGFLGSDFKRAMKA